jgi:Tol biopolymer transport system component
MRTPHRKSCLALFALASIISGCAKQTASSHAELQEHISGSWKDWNLWTSREHSKALFLSETAEGHQKLLLLAWDGAASRTIDLDPPRRDSGGHILDAVWSPDGRWVAVDTYGEEVGIVFLVDASTGQSQRIDFRDLAGSRSPRWDNSGDWLYFVPGLLDLSSSESGLYGYQLSTRKIYRLLDDIFIPPGFNIVGDHLIAVSIKNPNADQRLFSASLTALRENATELAHWDENLGEFVRSRSDSSK